MTRPSFTVTVDGQPPSGNHQYAPAKRRAKDGHEYLGLRKEKDVEAYQLIAVSRIRRARPRDWNPPMYQPKEGKGFVVLAYEFYLKTEVDCDNVMKILDDAAKWALDIDDKSFLPRAYFKITGIKQPRVEITFSCDE